MVTFRPPITLFAVQGQFTYSWPNLTPEGLPGGSQAALQSCRAKVVGHRRTIPDRLTLNARRIGPSAKPRALWEPYLVERRGEA